MMSKITSSLFIKMFLKAPKSLKDGFED